MKRYLTSTAACALAVASSVALGFHAEPEAVDAIKRYCTASWRQAGIAREDWEDCTQNVYLELLNRVSREGLVHAIEAAHSSQRRELNRAIWCTAQRWRRAPKNYALHGEPADYRQCRPDAMQRAREAIEAGFAGLSELQRAILSRSLDGYSVAEIAAALDRPASRISDEKYKAIAKLRRHAAQPAEPV